MSRLGPLLSEGHRHWEAQRLQNLWWETQEHQSLCGRWEWKKKWREIIKPCAFSIRLPSIQHSGSQCPKDKRHTSEKDKGTLCSATNFHLDVPWNLHKSPTLLLHSLCRWPWFTLTTVICQLIFDSRVPETVIAKMLRDSKAQLSPLPLYTAVL